MRNREISPVQVMTSVLEHINLLQPKLNCFIALCSQQAMEQAKLSEQALMRGHSFGPLHGVPFSVKDIVNTQDIPTSFGAMHLRDYMPKEDAVSVARLRRAGAILVGKTTTPEFGSKGFTDSPLFGRTCNAWHAQRTCGGSSGGAAVAVAAGMAPLAVATDGGGSTRIPAACNGVVGIKQSLGVVPHNQALDLFGNQTYVTPTTRTVSDTALMLDVMAGSHVCDPWSLGRPRVNYVQTVRNATDLRGKRFRYNLAPQGRKVAIEVERAFLAAIQRIEALGGEVEPFEAQLDIEPIWRTVNHTVWRTRFAEMVGQHRDSLSATFCRQIEGALDYSAQDYQQAMFARTRLFHTLQGWLDGVDFLLMPTLTRTALPLDSDIFDDMDIDGDILGDIRANWYPWTMPMNMTGHPAISVPCGFDKEQLPIGLQIVAPLFEDAYLLQVAVCLEEAFDLLNHWPSVTSYFKENI
ncbi:amidase family protein [Comamonas faecalis]|uniref:Amidase family protein n=1 Tax=Comamonas faecalis TaxID=1387849 RepID=A0ABP7QMW5_9BURK